MTIAMNRFEKKLGDYYWAYADILRDIGINESTYDQRIMAFMALKLLIDNDKLEFNFEYQDNFRFSRQRYAYYQGKDTKGKRATEHIKKLKRYLTNKSNEIGFKDSKNNNFLGIE
ncbi:MAG: hypothetical protein QM493_06770 [Sulfurovum sp.]